MNRKSTELRYVTVDVFLRRSQTRWAGHHKRAELLGGGAEMRMHVPPIHVHITWGGR